MVSYKEASVFAGIEGLTFNYCSSQQSLLLDGGDPDGSFMLRPAGIRTYSSKNDYIFLLLSVTSMFMCVSPVCVYRWFEVFNSEY